MINSIKAHSQWGRSVPNIQPIWIFHRIMDYSAQFSSQPDSNHYSAEKPNSIKIEKTSITKYKKQKNIFLTTKSPLLLSFSS